MPHQNVAQHAASGSELHPPTDPSHFFNPTDTFTNHLTPSAGAEASTSVVHHPNMPSDYSGASYLSALEPMAQDVATDQLEGWVQLLRNALKANDQYQDATLDLAKDMDKSLARLQDLEVGIVLLLSFIFV